MREISFDLDGLKLNPPIMLSSGIIGMGLEYSELIDYSYVGAIITKALSPKPKEGNIPPRLYETSSGLLNSIGLENPGLEVFKKELLPEIIKLPVEIVVNVACDCIEDYITVVSELENESSISAFEINISCPNVKENGVIFQRDRNTTEKLVSEIKKHSSKLLILKISAFGYDFSDLGKIAEDNGFSAVSIVNTYPAMGFDIERKDFVLGNRTGGLSGPAIKPMAVWAVYMLRKNTELPIIGGGGIVGYKDALEFFYAGAQAISLGTVIFSEPDAPRKISEGLSTYLDKFNLNKLILLLENFKKFLLIVFSPRVHIILIFDILINSNFY